MHNETGRTAITGEPDRMPHHGAVEFVVQPPLVNVRVMRTDTGKVVGIAQIQTQRGPLTFVASADERIIRWALHELLPRLVKQGKLRFPAAQTGAFGDWAKDLAGKIAKGRVINRLVDQAKAVGQNPQIARAVGLSTVVIPGHGSAVLALQSASELLQGLKRRDPKAMAAWRQLLAQARAGNLKARRSVHVVNLVARAPRIVARH